MAAPVPLDPLHQQQQWAAGDRPLVRLAQPMADLGGCGWVPTGDPPPPKDVFPPQAAASTGPRFRTLRRQFRTHIDEFLDPPLGPTAAISTSSKTSSPKSSMIWSGTTTPPITTRSMPTRSAAPCIFRWESSALISSTAPPTPAKSKSMASSAMCGRRLISFAIMKMSPLRGRFPGLSSPRGRGRM